MLAMTVADTHHHSRSRRRRGHAAAAVLAVLSCSQATVAFQPPQAPCVTHRNASPDLSLSAKPSKRSKSKSGGGFGSGVGGFSSKSPPRGASGAAVDHSRVRSVSGYTGSGTKALANAANDFDRIRKLYGKEATTDVYVRSPLNDESVFWFVGKVVRILDAARGDGGTGAGRDEPDGRGLAGTVHPTVQEAVLSQKRLILEYAKNQLRPQNMGGPYARRLELWTAPGDSEMDVVQNKVDLARVAGSTRDLREGFHVRDVGFNPEIYVGDEQKEGGLRVVRDAEGRPVKPAFEING